MPIIASPLLPKQPHLQTRVGTTLASAKGSWGLTPSHCSIVGQLGLGKGHPSSTLSQLNISRFSYCLPLSNSNPQNTNATLEFGPKAGLTTAYYYNTPIIEGPPDHPFDYYLNLTAIAVDNVSVYTPSERREGGEPGFVIDVGATVTVLYKEAYIPMKNAVMEYLSSHFGLYPVYPSPPEYDPPAYELCYYYEDLESLTTLTYPNISFHFEGGAVLQLPESQAFHNFVDELQTGLVMIPRTGTEPSRLGAPQQRGWRFTYDLLHSELSFAPNGC
ncbi:aspartyl protease AED1-like [Pyrus communis]|uniref:aspartyl protease AED1-like n=1 Tax=Pyrus communis TaxID=23211 RepID=UPI0035BF7388